jgi:hypothetical protein
MLTHGEEAVDFWLDVQLDLGRLAITYPDDERG